MLLLQLSVMHNASYAQIDVKYVNESISAEHDVRGIQVPKRDLTTLLVNPVLLIGGTTQASRGYVNLAHYFFKIILRNGSLSLLVVLRSILFIYFTLRNLKQINWVLPTWKVRVALVYLDMFILFETTSSLCTYTYTKRSEL